MNKDDLALRNLTYARFAELGRAPTGAEIAGASGRDQAEGPSAGSGCTLSMR